MSTLELHRRVIELKMVRRVKTPAGVRRFKQPIGSIIVRDSVLRNLTIGKPEYDGFDTVHGKNGKKYYIAQDSDSDRWFAYDEGDHELFSADDEDSIFELLDRHIGGSKAPAKKPTRRILPRGQQRSTGTRAERGDFHEPTDDERKNFVKNGGAMPIPPAWTDVRIADDLANSHLQATGFDVKGRPQSIYSKEWRASQDGAKFERIKQLDKYIDELDNALDNDYMEDDRAAALLLIRLTGMRPGSDRNTGGDQQAYGATNMRAKHVRINQDSVTFDFVGKKGVAQHYNVKDPRIVAVIRDRMAGKRGNDKVFDLRNEQEVRDYMREVIPGDFYLKDLRTHKGTSMALEMVTKKRGKPKTMTEYRRWRNEVGDAVAKQLGNTRSLALSAYIDPTVFAKWEAAL